ncbi:MAG: MBL fold metallo-hydrolase [Deltaproteobacteria bacterium]|nr:MBL fold metallo-hydrolase [Deltaproteobacteria bacterium]
MAFDQVDFEGHMEIVFCGTGEAFDTAQSNTSILIQPSGKAGGILLDCGFTAAHAFWATASRPMELDEVWISHFHGDHFFGLPLLLIRMREHGRSRPLIVRGGAGTGLAVAHALDLAYPGVREALGFGLEIHEVRPGTRTHEAWYSMAFASVVHAVPTLAVRVETADGAIYYGGDGRPTRECLDLALGVDLLVQESYHPIHESDHHSSAVEAMEFGVRAGARAMALVHIRRDGREDVREMARKQGLTVLVPDSGDRFHIHSLGESRPSDTEVNQ